METEIAFYPFPIISPRFEPTYKEWKLKQSDRDPVFPDRFEPTYKEWKRN